MSAERIVDVRRAPGGTAVERRDAAGGALTPDAALLSTVDPAGVVVRVGGVLVLSFTAAVAGLLLGPLGFLAGGVAGLGAGLALAWLTRSGAVRRARWRYDVTDAWVTERSQAVTRAAAAMGRAQRLWSACAQPEEAVGWRGAQPEDVRVVASDGAFTDLIVDVPAAEFSSASFRMLWLPDGVVFHASGGPRFVPWEAVRCTAGAVEDVGDRAPQDSEALGTTYLHTTRDGSPDRRFRENPSLARFRCGQLALRLGETATVLLRTSAVHAASDAARALSSLLTHETGRPRVDASPAPQVAPVPRAPAAVPVPPLAPTPAPIVFAPPGAAPSVPRTRPTTPAPEPPWSADEALRWHDAVKDTTGRAVRVRCDDSFRALFALRFGAQEPVTLARHVAGREARTGAERKAFERIDRVVDDCLETLDPLARWRARGDTGTATVLELAVLPAEIAADARAASPARALQRWLESVAAKAPALCSASDVLARCGLRDTPSRAEMTAVCGTLQRLGFGVAPDPRFGGAVAGPSDSLAVFPLPADAPDAPTEDFSVALALAELGARVAAAGGDASDEARQVLLEHVFQRAGLGAADRIRIAAHVLRARGLPASAASIRKLAGAVPEPARAAAADALVAIANADGRITAEEIDVLRKLFAALGLDADAVFARVHAHAAGAETPVTATAAEGVVLDMAAVRRKVEETAAVGALLGAIFQEDTGDATPAPRPDASVAPSPVQGDADPPERPIEGLDVAHSRLLRRLRTRLTWPTSEFDAEARACGVMPSGAREVLDTFALERAGETLFTSEDPVTLDEAVLAQLPP